MAIQIDEIQTDVQVDRAPAPTLAAPPESPWQKQQRLCQLQAQLRCDEARTRACGNED